MLSRLFPYIRYAPTIYGGLHFGVGRNRMKWSVDMSRDSGVLVLLGRIFFCAAFFGGIAYLLMHRGEEGAVELGIGIILSGMAVGLFFLGFDLLKLTLLLGGLFLSFAGLVNSGIVSAPFLKGRNPILLFVCLFPLIGLAGFLLLFTEALSLARRCTEQTEGVVIRNIRNRGRSNVLRRQSDGRRGYLNYNICYEYNWNGKHYEGAQKGLWPEKPGKHTILKIDPAHPEIFLSRPYRRYQRAAIFLAVLMLLLGSAASVLIFR